MPGVQTLWENRSRKRNSITLTIPQQGPSSLDYFRLRNDWQRRPLFWLRMTEYSFAK